MKVYGDIQSGNCYKIALLCALLDIQHEWIAVDILAQETATDSFISLYAYTHVAHEGGFDLSSYTAIQRWIVSIAAIPQYIDMR